MLDEYASRFYLFLDHALRIEAEDRISDLIVASYPHMKKQAQSKLMRKYRQVANGTKENATIDEDRRKLRKLFSQTTK